MSLPDLKSHGKPAARAMTSPVVQLNVGGHLFSTFLSTLMRHPDSRMAELFSGKPPKLRTDAGGRYFIDRDGTHFGAVLDYLRMDRVPTENIKEVLREALHYDIKPLVKLLSESPQNFGETVGRQQFLSRVPHYLENIEVLIRIARAEAVASRRSGILICVLRTEEDLGLHDNAMGSLEAGRESVVTFGPWKATPSVADLLDCVRMDVESRGYRVAIQPEPPVRAFLSRSYDCFFKVTFTWW
ncbi:BTB/POZ domain-containing protein KCTD14 isoform X1 [Gadus macrocephalus]|uniref:BTB/POZ domain-containing protein KCTD14 isoform X1 n=1 Tax=Gadus macrocephalus TaxID=80720 RepID=UPI0028CB9612|nr:BTB/POZ domain-containing protein KCTD14 isoform X1 [Gadus macrocephalus]